MKKDEITYIKENIDLLINGLDPKSKVKIDEDSILLSTFNRNLLKDVSKLLGELSKVGIFEVNDLEKLVEGKTKGKFKVNFQLTNEEILAIPKIEESISVSELTYILNNTCTRKNVKKLRPTQITSWLRNEKYLTEITHDDGKVFKVITSKASEIGMTSKAMENTYGRKYDVNLYSQKTVEYILTNIKNISEM